MNVVVTGGSGFLGRPLVRSLAHGGHTVVVLSRTANASLAAGAIRTVSWTPDGTLGDWAREVASAEAVVNLAGEPIAARRWSRAQKQRIIESRVLATQSLVRAIRASPNPSSVLISGSAVGYYGPHGDEVMTERAPAGRDFLARTCAEWEAAALEAASAKTRVVCIRTGLVIAKDGGALKRMLPPYRLGLGGPIGTGRQYWSWIHRQDWIDLVRWALDTPAASGPLNATASHPVTSADFARALGRELHRPAILPVPALVLRALLGELAGPLLLSGQRVVPARAKELGFMFRYPTLDNALRALFEG
jgi:uncharacterized protein (TIGR01777 family)